jgi:lambda repressor-like predicted transcriptional regulator
MNALTAERRAQVIAALVEGNSIRSVSRMTGVARNTVMSLLVAVGAACAEYQDKALRNLSCKRVQCDEIWSFCYAKDKNLPEDKQEVFGYGSVWTWTALDADTKLVCSWMVGNRDGIAAKMFIQDLASRLANRIQLTTDGHKAYLEAVDEAFGSDIDYAMLVKLYGGEIHDEARYSPAACIGTKTEKITGNPKERHISTSYVERQNLTNAYAYAEVYPPYECVLKEAGEPHCGDLPALHVLQFRSHSSDLTHYSGNGRWRDGSGLGSSGYCKAA